MVEHQENMQYEALKNALVSSIREAGKKVQQLSRTTFHNSLSKVTSFDYGVPADKAAEGIILTALKKSGVSCRIVTEESDESGNPDAEYTIYIDPLDGSVNFSRGVPTYCLAAAIYHRNKPQLGVIYDPNMKELFIAEKGKGISLNGKPLARKQFQGNVLINLEWFGADNYEDVVLKLRQANIRARTAGSGVLSLCYGTIGRGDGTILLENKPWDVAPGLVFAQENGIIVKQLNGKDVDLNEKKINLLAASPAVFHKILAAITE